MTYGSCCRCVGARWIRSMGRWCRLLARPAYGNGCSWWREKVGGEGRTC